jgi:hypothetical protein
MKRYGRDEEGGQPAAPLITVIPPAWLTAKRSALVQCRIYVAMHKHDAI